MNVKEITSKRMLVDKASQQVLITAGIAAFVVIFCLVASYSLFGQMMFQNRVASAKKNTLNQLKSNITAVSSLKESYDNFTSASPNVIGGVPGGTTQQDGDNGKIILDALPSKYDFPALATSLEKLMSSQGVQINSISGTDDEVAQSAVSSSSTPQPVPMPFEFTATGSYDSIKNLSSALEASIRPIQVQSMTVTSTNDGLTLTVKGQSYYQPEKIFAVGTQVIK